MTTKTEQVEVNNAQSLDIALEVWQVIKSENFTSIRRKKLLSLLTRFVKMTKEFLDVDDQEYFKQAILQVRKMTDEEVQKLVIEVANFYQKRDERF